MLIKKDKDVLIGYLEDSSNLHGGYAEELVLPSNAEELSEFVKEANSRKIPITVSAGGTNTTGSRIPFGGTIVSTEKFNKILDISENEKIARVQSGVIVEDLKKACEKKGLFYTSHPTEKTAFVGGTVATNASGPRSLKYGPTRKCVKRLKMIMPTGEVFEIRRGEIFLNKSNLMLSLPGGRVIDVLLPAYRTPDVKSSAGYYMKPGMDLIDLFIGQEGTLSIIFEADIVLVKKPKMILSSFVFFNEEPDAWLFSRGAKSIKDILSIEYFDSNALHLLRNKNANIPADKNAAIFFEQETDGKNDDAVMDNWARLIKSCGSTLDDSWVAMNEKEAEHFTELRHMVPESVNDIVRRDGFKKMSADIAVPDGKFLEMMNYYAEAFRNKRFEHVLFGHIGESHVHVNILPKSEQENVEARKTVLAFIRKGLSLGGTVSAEHGIGKIKHRYLEEMYGLSGVAEMARVKKAFDPNCILGLDNIFSRDLLNDL
ncbi:MAG: FAD-binding oxidoreductase [Candidatus Omnitrophota bacterium]|jgi:D-lactate dehydrogenase (cytochrome)